MSEKKIVVNRLVNEYEPIKNEELTLAEKKKIWKSPMYVSGSQIKDIRETPIEYYNQKINQVDKIFGMSQIRVMEFGNFMEPFIVENMKDATIEIDKKTYRSITNPWFTANVDGFLSDFNSNKFGIFEAKCTIKTDIDEIAKDYMNQLQYYMWFFNVKQVKLGMFSKKNCTYSYKTVLYDSEFVEKMLDDVEIMLNNLQNRTPPWITNLKVDIFDVNKDVESEKLFSDYKGLQIRLDKIKMQEKDIKKQQKEIGTILKEIAPKGTEKFVDAKNQIVLSVVSFPKSVKDFEAFKKDMEIMYNNGEAFADFEEKYVKTSHISYLRMSKL